MQAKLSPEKKRKLDYQHHISIYQLYLSYLVRYALVKTSLLSHRMVGFTEKATVTICSSDPHLASLLDPFLSASTTTSKMQSVVHQMTDLIISQAISTDAKLLISENTILILVLRAGLPMYVVAQNRLPNASCVPVRCMKLKGSRTVLSHWLGVPSFPTVSSTSTTRGEEGKKIVLLDTVIATGDTIVRLCDELEAMGGMAGCVTVLTCYASPDAIEKVAEHQMVGGIVVGSRAESVDDDGYLVPYTHGDVGDKMFGKASV